MPKRLLVWTVGLLIASAATAAPQSPPKAPTLTERLTLAPCHISREGDQGAGGAEANARCGTFLVPENRGLARSRMLPLRLVILPSRSPRQREPVFILSGGPGQPATDQAQYYQGGWQSENHEVVLLDLRGTGEGTALDCSLGGSDDDIQGYLDGYLADGAGYAACRDALQRHADLRQYTTMSAMRDLDELRQALGYRRINLEGGSYGTRAAITYIRMFPERVHAALLFSLVPLENRAPLYHAAAAQRALDVLVGQCRADAQCNAAYPDITGDLEAVLERLRAEPARIRVPHPVTGVPTEIRLGASGFADALRVMLYSVDSGRRVPLLLKRARAGDVVPFAEAALLSSRRFTQSIRAGLLLSFTCAEDVSRIRPAEVARETAGSFIGDQRVRSQMAACSVWPKGDVPSGYYRPLRTQVPAILVSGNLDPVTPPSWGELALRYFPNGIHIVLPGTHTPTNDCVNDLGRKLFLTGTTRGLNGNCAAATTLPAFAPPQ